MEATRLRFGSLLEWVFAAALVAGALAVGTLFLAEVRTVRPVMPVSAGPAPVTTIPLAIPPGAVSVPLLLLGTNREIRIGDRMSDVGDRIGGTARAIVEALDRTAVRDRITRIYQYGATTFVLVFDARDRGDEPEVAAIYVK
jgi:hypothetical protein